MEPKIQDYEIIKEVGSGSFGKVYKAIRKSDGKTIALKIIKVPDDNTDRVIDQTQKEIDYLKKLSIPDCYPFVICYYDSYYDPNKKEFYIEMEYIEGTTLDKYVNELWEDENKSKEDVYYYLLLITKDIAEGLKYSHSKGVIHNDIKLQNIMVDKNNIPRIVDYGLACIAIEGAWEQYCESHGGTPNYVAPELFSQGVRLPASDMWALGIALYLSSTKGEYPFTVSDTDTIQELFTIIDTTEPKKLSTSNSQLNDIVNGLLNKDFFKRLTAEQVIEKLKVVDDPNSSKSSNVSKPLSSKRKRSGFLSESFVMVGQDTTYPEFVTPSPKKIKLSDFQKQTISTFLLL
jgi:serine/threonine protein kinase